MIYDIENKEDIKRSYLALCYELITENKPLHPCPFLNCKFMGNYITLVQEEDEPKFMVHDLYTCERSKFYNRDKMYIDVFGDKQVDYSVGLQDALSKLSNKDLKKIPVGEAYRRSKYRIIHMGLDL